jgi:hypothetical protein
MLRRAASAVARAATSPGLIVKYYMSWETSSGGEMDVNEPEYDELSAWNEELVASLQAQGLEVEAEDLALMVYVNSASEVVKAIQAVEAGLADAAGGPSPVVSRNARESGFASVDPFD